MVLLEPLPSRTFSASAPVIGAGGLPSVMKPSRSLGPRIRELADLLDRKQHQKSAICELALLASRSASACTAVASGKLERKLVDILATSPDPSIQCWVMSVLANIASDSASRDRQAIAVPSLCSLVGSAVPEVQHSAALHLATLSHSKSLQLVISQNLPVMNQLSAIEGKRSASLASRANHSLQQEAAQYARWALRTPHGRNHKPTYRPKTEEELELEASIRVQKHFRSALRAVQVMLEHLVRGLMLLWC